MALLAALTLVMGAAAANAQSPVPSASATAPASSAPSAKPKPSASPASRTAIVSCVSAAFYSWPDHTLSPSGTHYPPARLGDAFGVIGTGSITPNQLNLTETTIDTFEPYGRGKHFWVATECID